jgi:hypothetical protein
MTFAPPDARARIYSEIEAERARQYSKHGAQLHVPIVIDADRKLIDHDEFLKRIYGLRDQKGTVSHALITLEEVAEMVHATTLEECEQEAIEVAACAVKLVEAIRWQRGRL